MLGLLFFGVCAVDKHLGRVEKHTFSPQVLMELFVADISIWSPTWGAKEAPRPIDNWENLIVTESGDVTDIRWSSRSLTGSIHLEWLPLTILQLLLWGNQLGGSLEMEELPDRMKKLDCAKNHFVGKVHLDKLPKAMEWLDLWFNMLSGSLDLKKLPRSLQYLFLHKNNFSGTVCLTKLPEELVWLSISQNSLSGALKLTKLPKKMKSLYLEDNAFVGWTNFLKLPDTLERLDVSNNAIEGTISPSNELQYAIDGTNIESDEGLPFLWE